MPNHTCTKRSHFHGQTAAVCRYVSGRTRAPGEINGKSANVNNCLKNVIYPEYAECLSDIPMTELVVVFDADMAAKRNFFLKVGLTVCVFEVSTRTWLKRTSRLLPCWGKAARDVDVIMVLDLGVT